MVKKAMQKTSNRELAYDEAAAIWLRSIRDNLVLKQREMAERTGIRESTLSRAETNSGTPKNLDEIIDAYAREANLGPDQARQAIVRLMFPEQTLAVDAQTLADGAQTPHGRRRAK